MVRVVLLFCFICLVGDKCFADTDTERNLRKAVSSMNSWLGGDSKARQWRELLDLNLLDTQSALGHRADPSTLERVLRKFDQDFTGLQHPVFQRVRTCIADHLIQLSKNRNDIAWTAETTKFQFRPPTNQSIEALRDDAVFRLEMLRRYYKQNINSRERALLFYDLKLNETIQTLRDMKFETTPARNAKTIELEIETLQGEITNVENQLEKLNQQLDKIIEWKNQPSRPEGVEPPSPDDDPKPSPDSTDALRSDANQEMEKIRSGQLALENVKQELQQQIETLQQEADSLKESEADRLQRFREWRSTFSPLENRFKSARLERNDLYFANAFEAIVQLRLAYFAAANPRTESEFERRIADLQKQYADYQATRQRRSAANLGYLTGWLDSAGQAHDLVAAVRAQHSLPNLFFEVTSEFINNFASQDIRECRPVEEQILSRLIRGVALVTGTGSVQFVPDTHQARVAIDLTGAIDSDTYTRSGRLTAYAGAAADYNVRRELFVNVGGFFAKEMYGDLQLNSYFKSIDSNLRIVQRVAYKQFLKTKSLAEGISAANARRQVFEQFKEQTDPLIADGYQRFESILDRQTGTSGLIPAMFLFTTHDRLVAVGHQSTRFDLAANNRPMCFNHIPADVRLKLNETLLSNYVSPLFAGRRLSNQQLAVEIATLLQREPRQPNNAQGFNVQFDDARPIQFEFDNNAIGVVITGVFQRAGNRSRNNLTIDMRFRLENQNAGLSLVPSGKVNVELVDPTKKNIGTASMISFLERILSDLLNESNERELLLPPNLIPNENLAPELKKITNQLALTQFRIEDQWLYAGWKYQPETSVYAGIVDTPSIQYNSEPFLSAPSSATSVQQANEAN